ncbi:ribokinase [Pontibacter silvestris]|uniref:Ribokinase n=1 Tax=Pontibacter silvestris TaxID=2305183 RepID=A0ABW4X4E1_9BACT|nr:ribokinase [Pontibacter silvestris]MCC9138330.1 ribokinase [Pontibacter silvestris]
MNSKGILLSLGSVNKDIQVRADRWPEPDETLMAKDLLTISGGKAANRAYIASKLGAPSILLARLGDDNEAEEALGPLREIGVNLDHTKRLQNQRTGLAMITVRPDGKKTIIAAGNANSNWEAGSADEVERVILEAPSNSVLTLDLEIPASVVKKALEAARKRDFWVVFDPSPTSQVKEEYYELADFMTPDLTEAERLVGFNIETKEDGFNACEAILKKGARHALLKMGDKGYIMITDGKSTHLPAPDVQVTDTTGAGDAFAGAFGFALWDGQTPADAMRFAAVASSLAVETYGSQPAYPDRNAIENKLAEISTFESGAK